MPEEAPVFAYTSDHMCWVTPFTNEKSIFIFNIKTLVLRKFDPTKYMALDDDGHNYLVNACDPVQLLAQGFRQSPRQDRIDYLSEFLQIWNISDHMLMVDLNNA